MFRNRFSKLICQMKHVGDNTVLLQAADFN